MGTLKEISQQLVSLLDQLDQEIEKASFSEQVEIGTIFWDVGDQASKRLDRIKVIVREEAKKALPESGTKVYEGSEGGTCSVTVPGPSTRLVKGTDMQVLKQKLGEDFPLFFEEVTTFKPREEFRTRVLNVEDEANQKALVKSVEQKENTPRVSFRRAKTEKKSAPPTPSKKATVDVEPSILDDLIEGITS